MKGSWVFRDGSVRWLDISGTLKNGKNVGRWTERPSRKGDRKSSAEAEMLRVWF